MKLNTLKPVVPLAVLVGMRYIDKENPQTVAICRIYAAMMFITVFMIYVIIYRAVRETNDQRTVKVKDSQTAEEISMKVVDYDTQQVLTALKTIGAEIILIPAIHLYFGIFPRC